MSTESKRQMSIEPLPGYEPEIGRMLWMLENERKRSRRSLDAIHPDAIDWEPHADGNSIGTLLYHIALIELDWLATEIMEGKLGEDIFSKFPHPVRDAQGRLTVVKGISLDEHYRRLDSVRMLVLNSFKGMSIAEFRRLRHLPDYDVTPEWVLHHLMQHEAEHRGEMATVRTLAEKAVSG